MENNQIEDLEDEIRSLKDDIEDLEDEIRSLKDDIEDLEDEICSLMKEQIKSKNENSLEFLMKIEILNQYIDQYNSWDLELVLKNGLKKTQ